MIASPPRRYGRSHCALSCALIVGLVAPSGSIASGTASISGSVDVYMKGGKKKYDDRSNAVVWLSGAVTPTPTSPVTVGQRKKKFRPRVLPVVRGQELHFLNQDRIEHNVFSTEAREPFDLGRYPKGEYRSVTFDQLGRYKVYCNIHKEMILDLVVLENEYFAVSDEDGSFSIEGVPDGRYELHVWHIYGGEHQQPVEVRGEPIGLDPISVTSTRVVRDLKKHLDKEGRRYKKAYRDR